MTRGTTGLARLHIGGVAPEVGPIAFKIKVALTPLPCSVSDSVVWVDIEIDDGTTGGFGSRRGGTLGVRNNDVATQSQVDRSTIRGRRR